MFPINVSLVFSVPSAFPIFFAAQFPRCAIRILGFELCAVGVNYGSLYRLPVPISSDADSAVRTVFYLQYLFRVQITLPGKQIVIETARPGSASRCALIPYQIYTRKHAVTPRYCRR